MGVWVRWDIVVCSLLCCAVLALYSHALQSPISDHPYCEEWEDKSVSEYLFFVEGLQITDYSCSYRVRPREWERERDRIPGYSLNEILKEMLMLMLMLMLIRKRVVNESKWGKVSKPCTVRCEHSNRVARRSKPRTRATRTRATRTRATRTRATRTRATRTRARARAVQARLLQLLRPSYQHGYNTRMSRQPCPGIILHSTPRHDQNQWTNNENGGSNNKGIQERRIQRRRT